ncbi:hypothetical protein [Sinomicrobium sp.]
MKQEKMKKISPEQAQSMLKKEGLDISLEQAEEVLLFLRKMANIVVYNYLNQSKHREDS